MLLTMAGVVLYVTMQTSENKHIENFQQIQNVSVRIFDLEYKLCNINNSLLELEGPISLTS